MTVLGSKSFVVVDAGARYGLHPSWEPAAGIAEFHLFEAEPVEAARLAEKYSLVPNIQIYNMALDEQPGILEFELRQHRALTSTYPYFSEEVAENYLTERFASLDTFEVKAETLDNLFKEHPVHFLKLDVEGAELRVLAGAKDLLRRTVEGVRAEVCFSPVYDGAPLFSEIDSFLRDCGFVLLNLDYDGRGVARNSFTLNEKYGRLVSTDGVWVKPFNSLLDANSGLNSQGALRYALFLLLNGSSDSAVEALEMFVDSGGSLVEPESGEILQAVRRQLALLFKELQYLPQFENSRILSMWTKLFREPFPELNNFWESIDQ
jgi:FkbM family methyltransferase